MARKLKSDQMLFLATILLVCLSIVMVYSASAVVAMERYQQPYLFLTKQLMWATLGLALLWRRDADRLPHLPRAGVHLVLPRASSPLCLVAVLFSPPVNNARRWFGIGGLGIQPSELAKLSAIFFIAALLERRMHRINELGYALLPIGRGRRRAGRADPARARLRHGDVAGAHCRGHGVCGRPQLRATSSARSLLGAAADRRARR